MTPDEKEREIFVNRLVVTVDALTNIIVAQRDQYTEARLITIQRILFVALRREVSNSDVKIGDELHMGHSTKIDSRLALLMLAVETRSTLLLETLQDQHPGSIRWDTRGAFDRPALGAFVGWALVGDLIGEWVYEGVVLDWRGSDQSRVNLVPASKCGLNIGTNKIAVALPKGLRWDERFEQFRLAVE